MSVSARLSKVLSVSLPPTLVREAEKVAQLEGRTRSELFREALRRYLQERQWQEIQAYGAKQVKRLGLKSRDVNRLITEYRRGE